jgi:hypothetical protein
MNGEQQTIILLSSIVAFAALIFGLYFFVKWRNRQSLISAIKNGRGVLTKWNYSPEEWRWAAENNFEIGAKPGDHGRVFFTARHIYLTNGRKDILWELIGQKKFVKHLTEIFLLKQSPMNVVKFTVRTKTIKKDDRGNDTMDENYDVEYFYVPVPANFKFETEKVLKFYQDILDRNPDAVAAVMPYGLGLFGK